MELGLVAQLVEQVLCKHQVSGSIPLGSTRKRSNAGMAKLVAAPGLGPGGGKISVGVRVPLPVPEFAGEVAVLRITG